MQLPVIDRLNDLQLGLNSLQNPSFLSQITSSLSGINSVSVAYNFCKWGAFILAIVATCSSIINRVTIFIIRFRRKVPSLPNINFDTDDYSSTDDDDETSSSLSSEFEDEDESATSSRLQRVDQYFGVRGFGRQIDDECQSRNRILQRRRSIGEMFSLSEIANSKSVVKLWDSIGFGLGLDFDSSTGDDNVSVYDVNENRFSSIPVVNPPMSTIFTASPAVVVSVRERLSGNMAVEIWDTRLRHRQPSVITEWRPTVGNTMRVESGGVQEVYVTDDGGYGVTVGDMRNVSSPVVTVTESDADTWWDADAIVVTDESYEQDQSLLKQN